MIQIPWPQGASWRQEISIDSRVYRMQGRWNDVGEFWSFDLLTRAGTPLVMGVKLVLGSSLIAQIVDDRLPTGDFVVVTNDGVTSRPGRNDMLVNARLVYVPAV